MKLLFVCSTNICRSPYAEFHFRRMMQQDPALNAKIEWVRSAAVLNHAKHINHKTREALLCEGFLAPQVDAHCPRHIADEKALVLEADLIIGMTKWHKTLLPRAAQKKFLTLSEAAGGAYCAIPDPWLFHAERYLACLQTMQVYFAPLAERIKAADNFFAPKQ